MASDTQNCLQFEGNQKEINRLLRAIQGTDPDLQPIDFTKIIPMPTELEIDAGSQTEAGLDAFREFVRTTGGNKQHEKEYLSRHGDIDREAWKLGKQAFQNIQRYGHPTWFEWCAEH